MFLREACDIIVPAAIHCVCQESSKEHFTQLGPQAHGIIIVLYTHTIEQNPTCWDLIKIWERRCVSPVHLNSVM